ncbi:outer membrane protein assembly factor BamB [Dokdonella sp.]|uniref:outer membrane protein assembly factor BamB n=1 Tax=Dokdonella sp. TaxID=2291710 RepID=UPI003C3BAF4B
MKRALLAVVILSLGLGGCNWIKSIGGKKDNVVPPTPLVEIAPTVSTQKLWSTSVSKGAGKSGAHMNPALDAGRLYVASVSGEIAALDAASGRKLWSTNVKNMEWAGGPAARGDLLVVGALNGQVRGYSTQNGSELWQVQLSSEIICAPTITEGLVAVRSQDGRLFGLDPANGTRLWVYEQAVPVLSLRGNASPVIGNGLVYDGYDSGRVVAVRQSDGAPAWSQVLSTGEGRTEVERLADSDGPIVLDQNQLFATAYSGQIAALDAASGRPGWSRELSSFAGLSVAENAVVVSDAEGNVWGFDRQTGSNLWKQDALLHRWLSPPAIVGNYAIVGDLEGYVHWLNLADGSFAARQKLGKNPIESAPVVDGDVVYIEDVSGNIVAYRTQ